MVEKAEDIIYYEEPADDGTTWYRCDYRGIAIRKPKSMFEGGEEIHIKEEFFRHITQENIYGWFNCSVFLLEKESHSLEFTLYFV